MRKVQMKSFFFLLHSQNSFNFTSTSFNKFSLLSLHLHFSSDSSPSKQPTPHPLLTDYLINTLGFSKSKANSTSIRFNSIKTTEKPESAVSLLKQFGFSETQIRNAVQVTPQLLFADVEKILKPKLRFFQDLGFQGNDLGKFISKNTSILTGSLDKKLIPSINILKKLVSGDDLIRVLLRCKWIITKDPESRLLKNISLLQSYGIIGSQLSNLLKRQPILFAVKEETLMKLLVKTEKMGFSSDSRMFFHGLYTISCISSVTLKKKYDLFKSLGFSEDECLSMFRSSPALMRCSTEKLKLGVEFYLNNVGINRISLVHNSTCLMHSIENRVIPRFKVVDILRSKRLLRKKELSFLSIVQMTEKKFLERFISKFKEIEEDLLVAYKGHLLDDALEE